MPCVLVSCCGLPAAGKTSFCRSIVNCGAPLHQSPSPSTPSYGVHVTHICFDKYIDLALQRARQPQHSPAQRRAVGPKIGGLPDKAENSNTGEKQPDEVARDPQYSTRRDGSTLHCDNNNGAVDEIQEREEEAAWWHEGRRDAMAAVEALAARNPALAAAVVQGQEVREEAQTNGNDTTRTGPCGWGSAKEEYVRCEENEQSVFVVLVDDNMHFRSMRHEVLRLAREYKCGYAQVFFPTAAGVAIERDARRKFPVSEAVIVKMAQNLQPPDSNRFSWERHTVVVQSQKDGNVDSAHDGCAGGSQAVEGTTQTVGGWGAAISSFWEVVAAAAEDPVPPLPTAHLTSAECKSADREATTASVLHRLDLDMREAAKILAEQGARSGLTRDMLRRVMNACAVSRKATLHRARATEKVKTVYYVGGNGSPSFDCSDSPDARRGDSERDNGNVASFSDSGVSTALKSCSSTKSVFDTHGRSSGSGESMARGALPLDAFVVEFERAIRGIDELNASLRRGLVEAVKGVHRSR